MNKKLLITGAILGVLAIVLGAFAAHGLKALIDDNAMRSFETGVRYQMYHAFLLLILGSTTFVSDKIKRVLLNIVVTGIFFFSGSIYGLATNDLSSFDFTSIAMITPLGGLLLIVAWIVMLIGIMKNKDDK
jgi:uncharacterized membrane protein YgdD (TMEM256/DUF423 family)